MTPKLAVSKLITHMGLNNRNRFRPTATLIDRLMEAVILLAVGLTPLLFSLKFSELFEFPKMIFIYFLAIVGLTLLLIKWLCQKQLNFIKTPVTWPLIIFILWLILTTLTSLHPYTSIVGYYTRFNDGLASYIAYTALFYLTLVHLTKTEQSESEASSQSQKIVRILWVWLLSATITSIWAISEHLGHDPSCLIINGTFGANCWVQDVQARVFSTFGQPNWLAAYLVASIPVSLVLLLISISNRAKWVAAIATVLTYAAFWYTYSRSGWFGLIAALVILGLCLSKKLLWQHKFWLIAIIGCCLVISLTSFNSAALRAESSLSGQGDDSSTGSIRLLVWQGALQDIQDHLILGTGPSTFAYSFLPYRPAAMNNTTEWNFLYNLAHNQVLNTAATIGIPGLAIWLSLFIITALYVWQQQILSIKHMWMTILQRQKGGLLIRTKNESNQLAIQSRIVRCSLNAEHSIQAALTAGIAGVFISQLLGFAVVATNLLLFLSLAIIFAPAAQSRTISLTAIKKYVFTAISIAILLPTSYFLLMYASADITVGQADAQGSYNPIIASEMYQKAVAQNPWEPQYRLKYAAGLIGYAAISQSPQPLLKQADQQIQQALKLNPHDLIVTKNAVFYYQRLSLQDADYNQLLLRTAQKTVQLAPTDADARQTLADIQLSQDKKQPALESFNLLVTLRPLAGESYFHRAKYYQKYGLIDKQKQDLEKVLLLDPGHKEAQKLLSEMTED